MPPVLLSLRSPKGALQVFLKHLFLEISDVMLGAAGVLACVHDGEVANVLGVSNDTSSLSSIHGHNQVHKVFLGASTF